MATAKFWDIFCRVIDNYGDIGVCWRLSAELARRGERVRLWVDDASALQWMAPQGAPGVELRHWGQQIDTLGLPMGDILIEAFGCDAAPEFIAAYREHMRRIGQDPVWINLEYLSAQGFSQRAHGLPSPITNGPGKGLSKRFFYPGFGPGTGGLLRESDLATRQAKFDRLAWLRRFGIDFQGERLVSLFCYEPAALAQLLNQLAADQPTTRLLVTAGRAAAAVRTCLQNNHHSQPSWNERRNLCFSFLPALSQVDFDHLLWACDFNFVRGEDSLVRALWADKPLVWQIYPQHDEAHHAKLEAFLDMLAAPASLRAFHQVWNGVSAAALPPLLPGPWQQTAACARSRLMRQEDLVIQLIRFVRENH